MPQNSQPLELEEALSQLYRAIQATGDVETIPLSQACGRILAATVPAPLDLPPFRASAMDGYAVRARDFANDPQTIFQIVGESSAGHPYPGDIGKAQCVRIFTGAKLPDGADQVLLQEEALTVQAGQVAFQPHRPGELFVRNVGHDVSAGTPVADARDKLGAFTLGALAAAGVDQLSVFKLPKVGVFSTGDELVEPGTAPADLVDGQIYDSNRFTVINLLRDTPCELLDLGRLADDPVEVDMAFQDATERCDILITSGGVSVGEADFITTTIQQQGRLEFWRLNLKPGKPMAFGRIKDCYVFGLPGNPVSTIVTLLLLAKPAIWHYAGAQPELPLRVQAKLAELVLHKPGRTEYQRGKFTTRDGTLRVSATGDQSSNRLQTFHGANCLIEVPGKAGDLDVGCTVNILPFEGLLG